MATGRVKWRLSLLTSAAPSKVPSPKTGDTQNSKYRSGPETAYLGLTSFHPRDGCCAAGQTTKDDGLPHGRGFFIWIHAADGHDNTIEKPAEGTALNSSRRRNRLRHQKCL